MFEPGREKTGGRQKGTPNKATKAQQAISDFVDGNAHRLQQWLDELYQEKGAEAALNAFSGFVEYHIPKLQRTEQQFLDEDGEPTAPKMTVEFIGTNNPPPIR